MLAILPIINFIFFYFSFLKQGHGFRKSLILSSIVWGCGIVISIEALNVFHAIYFSTVVIFWLLLLIINIFVLIFNKQSVGFSNFRFSKLEKIEWVMLLSAGFILLAVFVVAFLSVPNSWDAVNYHMSRVFFWQQNKSVDHYPTPEFRQLYFQPWMSYAILHFQILTQTDRWANVVSWFAFAGSVIGVSYISSLLAASRREQILCAFLAATIPTAIIEASGVRIDMVVVFWMVCLVGLLLSFERTGKFLNVIFFALGLGLACLTKGTTFLIVGPFCLWMAYRLVKKFGLLKAVQSCVLIVLVVVLINLGFFVRNFQSSSQILGPKIIRTWGLSHDMTLGLMFSNTFKTTMYQMGNALPGWNAFVVNFVEWVHKKLSIDIIDDRGTINETAFYVPVSTHEDSVTNFLQMSLIFISFCWLGCSSVLKKDRRWLALMVSLAIGFVVINTQIRWNNHITRYQLPFFVLSMVIVAAVINKNLFNKKWVAYILIVSLFATAMPYVFKNNLRRLISKGKDTVFNTTRDEQYFRDDKDFYLPYLNAVEELRNLNCRDIGIYMPFNHWDYPLLQIAKEKLGNNLRMEHVYINQLVPENYPLGNFYPCALISVGYAKQPEEVVFQGNNRFYKVKDFARTSVYVSDKPFKISPIVFQVLK